MSERIGRIGDIEISTFCGRPLTDDIVKGPRERMVQLTGPHGYVQCSVDDLIAIAQIADFKAGQ